MTTQNTPPTPADPLEALAASVELEQAANDAAAAPGQTGQAVDVQPIPSISNAEVIAAAISAGRDMFCMFTKLQSPARTLDANAVQLLAQQWGGVCDKRGLNLSATLGDYALELGAVVATIAVARSVYAAARDELAVLRAETRTRTPNDDAPAPYAEAADSAAQ